MNIIDNRPMTVGSRFKKVPYGSTFAYGGEVYQRINRNSHPLTRNLDGDKIGGKEGLAVMLSNAGGIHVFNHATTVQTVEAELTIK